MNFKKKYIKDEKHRRFVASLPCLACPMTDRSQAAHIGGVADGKGMGKKVSDDRVVPLCADSPDDVGCHTKHDKSNRVKFWGKKYDKLDDLMNALYVHTGNRESAIRSIVQFKKGEW